MTVFMAALLLLKSQTSITESSSPLEGAVKVAADKSSPLKGADLGLSRTGSLLLFFLRAAKGFGPEEIRKSLISKSLLRTILHFQSLSVTFNDYPTLSKTNTQFSQITIQINQIKNT